MSTPVGPSHPAPPEPTYLADLPNSPPQIPEMPVELVTNIFSCSFPIQNNIAKAYSAERISMHFKEELDQELSLIAKMTKPFLTSSLPDLANETCTTPEDFVYLRHLVREQITPPLVASFQCLNDTQREQFDEQFRSPNLAPIPSLRSSVIRALQTSARQEATPWNRALSDEKLEKVKQIVKQDPEKALAITRTIPHDEPRGTALTLVFLQALPSQALALLPEHHNPLLQTQMLLSFIRTSPQNAVAQEISEILALIRLMPEDDLQKSHIINQLILKVPGACSQKMRALLPLLDNLSSHQLKETLKHVIAHIDPKFWQLDQMMDLIHTLPVDELTQRPYDQDDLLEKMVTRLLAVNQPLAALGVLDQISTPRIQKQAELKVREAFMDDAKTLLSFIHTHCAAAAKQRFISLFFHL